MSKKLIIVMRHGERADMLPGAGNLGGNPPLSPAELARNGHATRSAMKLRQALIEQLGEDQLTPQNVRIVTSPFRRCRQTTEIVGMHLPHHDVIVDPKVCEIFNSGKVTVYDSRKAPHDQVKVDALIESLDLSPAQREQLPGWFEGDLAAHLRFQTAFKGYADDPNAPLVTILITHGDAIGVTMSLANLNIARELYEVDFAGFAMYSAVRNEGKETTISLLGMRDLKLCTSVDPKDLLNVQLYDTEAQPPVAAAAASATPLTAQQHSTELPGQSAIGFQAQERTVTLAQGADSDSPQPPIVGAAAAASGLSDQSAIGLQAQERTVTPAQGSTGVAGSDSPPPPPAPAIHAPLLEAKDEISPSFLLSVLAHPGVKIAAAVLILVGIVGLAFGGLGMIGVGLTLNTATILAGVSSGSIAIGASLGAARFFSASQKVVEESGRSITSEAIHAPV